MGNIRSFRELDVYNAAMDAAMEIFERTKTFPDHERYAMVDQMRRSSRSVCANIAEAWRRRRSEAHFCSKLGDAESEAEETRVWIEFAYRCEYLRATPAKDLDERYDQILAQLVHMISTSEDWILRT
ncbi:MAG: four helix bundle protein [Salinivenus sp.]